jgi:hypothetical protein
MKKHALLVEVDQVGVQLCSHLRLWTITDLLYPKLPRACAQERNQEFQPIGYYSSRPSVWPWLFGWREKTFHTLGLDLQQQ